MAKKQPILSASLVDTPPVSLTPAQPGRPAVGWDVGRFERLIYDQGYDAGMDASGGDGGGWDGGGGDFGGGGGDFGGFGGGGDFGGGDFGGFDF